MATITSAGLGSGLDINGIITKLMQVESQPFTAMATKEASYQAKLSAFGSLKGALSTLQTAAQTLKNTRTFTGMSASSSDSSVVSVSGSSIAAAGTHSISVTQLAKFQSVRSNDNYAATTDTFNTGTLPSRSVAGRRSMSRSTAATTRWLAFGMRSTLPMRALQPISYLPTTACGQPSSCAHLQDQRLDRAPSPSRARYTPPAAAACLRPGRFDFSGTETATMEITQAADDAEADGQRHRHHPLVQHRHRCHHRPDAEPAQRHGHHAGYGNLTVAKNTGAVTSAVSAFVKAYNDAVNGIKTLTAYDAANKKASVLTGDSTARSIQSQLSALVGTSVSGIAGGISRLSDIGISVQKDGTLALDSSKLSAALADTSKDVTSLFTQTTSGNEGIAVRINTMLEGIVGSSGMISQPHRRHQCVDQGHPETRRGLAERAGPGGKALPRPIYRARLADCQHDPDQHLPVATTRRTAWCVQ